MPGPMVNSFVSWTTPLTVAVAAAIISASLIVVLRPFLIRYALARPNARSSHREPTPQGGGIAVIAAMTIVVACALMWQRQDFNDAPTLAGVFATVLFLAIVGISDDVRPLEAAPRLVLQSAAVAVVIALLPSELRIVPGMPWWLERAGLLIGGVWFVNLVNFMDGIDWMTVAEVVPITVALAAFGLAGALPTSATITSFALCGAMLGFAPFNRPVASIFLGDVGSLPIALTLAWLLALLAGGGHFVAALLLPLYYLMDATVTLARRLAKGERIAQAHRSHFYQRAIDGGFTVRAVIARVLLVNGILVAGAAATLLVPSRSFHTVVLAGGVIVVATLLRRFACATPSVQSEKQIRR